MDFKGSSTAKVIGARMKWFLVNMMVNDVRGWMGPKFYLNLSYSWGKLPEKTQPGKLNRPGIEPWPSRWEAMMLPFDNSGEYIVGYIRFPGHVNIRSHWCPYEMIYDDYDGQLILGGLTFPVICLTGAEKPRKKPYPGNVSRPGIEPGPAAWQACMLPLAPQRCTSSYSQLMFSNHPLYNLLPSNHG